MNCKQTSEYLIEFLDGRLAARRRAEVEAHLAACAACRQRAAAFRAVSALLGEWQPTDPSLGFDARMAEKIESVEVGAWSWWPVWLRPVYVATLAVVLVVAGLLVWHRATPIEPSQPTVAVKKVPAPPSQPQAKSSQDEDVKLLENLAVLENAQMLDDFDVLSEMGPAKAPAKKKL